MFTHSSYTVSAWSGHIYQGDSVRPSVGIEELEVVAGQGELRKPLSNWIQ